MKISRHFFESLSDYQDLIPVLKKAGIPYRTLLNPADEPYLLVFDIIVDSPEWKIFVDEFPKHLSFPNSSAQMIFDEKEVESARWLAMFCRLEKDVACEDLEGITFSAAPCRHTCVQIDDYRFKCKVIWGRSHFLMPMNVIDIFVDDLAKDVMIKEHLSGVDFRPVKKKKTDVIIPNVNQLVSTNILPQGTVIIGQGRVKEKCEWRGYHQVRYDNGDVKEKLECSVCHKVQYICDDLYQFKLKREVLEKASLDCYTTADRFGMDGQTQWIVSQRFYQVLKAHQMTRSLVFEPVELVD